MDDQNESGPKNNEIIKPKIETSPITTRTNPPITTISVPFIKRRWFQVTLTLAAIVAIIGCLANLTSIPNNVMNWYINWKSIKQNPEIVKSGSDAGLSAADKCPGFSWVFAIEVHHSGIKRNNFIADAGERADQNRISLFVDPDDNLCFRIIGDDFRPVTLQVNQSYGTFVFDNRMLLICEYGVSDTNCFIRMFINGKKMAENLDVSPLNSPTNWMNLKPTIPPNFKQSVMVADGVIFGEDINFENGGNFTMGNWALFNVSLPQKGVDAVIQGENWLDGFHDKQLNFMTDSVK